MAKCHHWLRTTVLDRVLVLDENGGTKVRKIPLFLEPLLASVSHLQTLGFAENCPQDYRNSWTNIQSLLSGIGCCAILVTIHSQRWIPAPILQVRKLRLREVITVTTVIPRGGQVADWGFTFSTLPLCSTPQGWEPRFLLLGQQENPALGKLHPFSP